MEKKWGLNQGPCVAIYDQIFFGVPPSFHSFLTVPSHSSRTTAVVVAFRNYSIKDDAISPPRSIARVQALKDIHKLFRRWFSRIWDLGRTFRVFSGGENSTAIVTVGKETS
jgi:hypothetical protein